MGGITSAVDVIEFIMVGATAVQICTQAILQGQTIYGKIASDVETWLKHNNYDSLEDIRGIILKKLPSKMNRPQAVPVIDPACNLCGICIGTCVYEALTIQENNLILNSEKCYGCGLCTTICPRYAIKFHETAWDE